MDEEIPDQIKQFMEQIKKRNELAKCVDERLEAHGEKVEREVLMGLWGDLGNQFDYYASMKAAAVFMKALKGMRKISKLPLPMALIVGEALLKVGRADIEAMQIIEKAKEEHGLEP